jgi:hypothetical protein
LIARLVERKPWTKSRGLAGQARHTQAQSSAAAALGRSSARLRHGMIVQATRKSSNQSGHPGLISGVDGTNVRSIDIKQN